MDNHVLYGFLDTVNEESTAGLIGGVFALENTDSRNGAGQSVWEHWVQHSHVHCLFHNARSAIAHLINQSNSKTFWMPAFICPEVANASVGSGAEVSFYPLDEHLRPNTDFLDKHIQANDSVLVVNFFGRPYSNSLKDFVKAKQSVTWIEDCSQAFDAKQAPLGRFRIYSPRKLLGVPDGGLLLVFSDDDFTVPRLSPLINEGLYRLPSQLRAQHLGKGRNDLWYPAFQAAEAAMNVSLSGASALTKPILLGVDAHPIGVKRKANYLYLLEALKELAFIDEPPIDWVPLGFPIRVDNQTKVLAHLHRRKIFASCHWRHLGTSQAAFPLEHKLAHSLITLPCDQRYDLDDMAYVVSALRSVSP